MYRIFCDEPVLETLSTYGMPFFLTVNAIAEYLKEDEKSVRAVVDLGKLDHLEHREAQKLVLYRMPEAAAIVRSVLQETNGTDDPVQGPVS